GTAPLGSRIREYTVAAPTQRQAPAANNHASWPADRSAPPISRIPRPKVTATSPDAVVARPLICPRSPLGTVRPWTSLDAIEHRQRPRANVASANTMINPATSPPPKAAVVAMAPTHAAWTTAPATNTHLR